MDETTYRGYGLHILEVGVLVYDAQGEYVDTFGSTRDARALIDSWVEGSVR